MVTGLVFAVLDKCFLSAAEAVLLNSEEAPALCLGCLAPQCPAFPQPDTWYLVHLISHPVTGSLGSILHVSWGDSPVSRNPRLGRLGLHWLVARAFMSACGCGEADPPQP